MQHSDRVSVAVNSYILWSFRSKLTSSLYETEKKEDKVSGELIIMLDQIIPTLFCNRSKSKQNDKRKEQKHAGTHRHTPTDGHTYARAHTHTPCTLSIGLISMMLTKRQIQRNSNGARFQMKMWRCSFNRKLKCHSKRIQNSSCDSNINNTVVTNS